MIDKAIRTISEKTTSVEDKIELSQKGTISIGMQHGGVIAVVPTSIDDPKVLTITPMNHAAKRVFERWSCDMELYPATEASIATQFSNATAASLASGGVDMLAIYNGKVYLSSSASIASGTWLASDSLYASESYFKQIPWIASNEAKLLKVSLMYASMGSATDYKNVKFSYEVRGY